MLLVLLSDESASQPWINFEAGVGDGSGARVIPVSIRKYSFGKLEFPLKGFQGRYVEDIEGLLFDIDKWTGKRATPPSKVEYIGAMRKAEESVTYKSILLWPVRTTYQGRESLMFEVENRGNIDVDLLFIEVRVPREITADNWVLRDATPTLEVDHMQAHYLVRYYSVPNNISRGVRRLEPTLTRSMGVRRLRDLRFPLKPNVVEEAPAAVIRFQIHGRYIDTQMEELALKDIPVVPEKCG